MLKAHSAPKSARLRWGNFWSDYTLPLALSLVFLILVIVAGGIRAYQQGSLAKLLAAAATVGQTYSSLLSNDKTNPATRDTANDLGVPAGSTQSGNFVVVPGSAGSGSAGTGSSPGPSLPFTAAITAFTQSSVTLECSSAQQNKAKCSKRYAFSAVVLTQHGPGTVQYGWRSNWQAANTDASYSAVGGTAQKTLTTSLLIPCLSPGSYNLQFVLTAPVQAQSSILNFVHNCTGI